MQWVPMTLDNRFLLSCDPASSEGALGFLVMFTSQMSSILRDIHLRGCRHGDLKPANIGVASPQGVVVYDFGLSNSRCATSGTPPFKIGPKGVFFDEYPWESSLALQVVDYMFRSSADGAHLHSLLHKHSLFVATKTLGSA